MGTEDAKALKELLEAEIITQDEFNAKMRQISSRDNAPNLSDAYAQPWVDLDALKILDEDNEGGFSQPDITTNMAQLGEVGADTQPNETGFNIISWIKRNVAAAVIIALLAGVLAFVLPQYATSQEKINELSAEIEKLNSTIDGKNSTISSLTTQKMKLGAYEDVVKYFYLDNAVMVIEGGGNVYHRYGCPKLPSQYTYWLYNVDAALDHGYRQCPTCFGKSIDDFCKTYIE